MVFLANARGCAENLVTICGDDNEALAELEIQNYNLFIIQDEIALRITATVEPKLENVGKGSF